MSFHCPPCGLYRIRVGARLRVYKVFTMIYGQMPEIVCFQILITRKTVAMNYCSRFHFFLYYPDQRFFSSILYWYKKTFFTFPAYSSKHPLSLYRSPPVIFSFPEFCLVDFYHTVWPSNFFRRLLLEKTFSYDLATKTRIVRYCLPAFFSVPPNRGPEVSFIAC